MTSIHPDQPSPVRTAVYVTDLPAPPQPIAVLRAMGGSGARHVLLESAGAPRDGATPPSIRRSILAMRPLLHMETRRVEGRARTVWEALTEDAAPLLARLAALHPGAREPAVAAVGGRLTLDAEIPTRGSGAGVLEDGAVLRQPSALDPMRATAGLLRDAGDSARAALAPGVFGALAYDLVDHFEELPARRPDPVDDPDVGMVLCADFVVWDSAGSRAQVITRGLPWETVDAVRQRHGEQVALVRHATAETVDWQAVVAGRPRAARAGPTRGPADGPTNEAGPRADDRAGDRVDDRARDWATDADAALFCARVERFLAAIRDGEIFQGVLSRGLHRATHASSLDIYAALSAQNPSPYMFHADLGRGTLLGASPETCVRVVDGSVELRPIAGTAPRGRRADGSLDPDLDGRLGLGLLLDPKEQAEHAMLLDLARNDVARVSVPGSTHVVEQFALEGYSHVQHLVSRVRGRLAAGLDGLHAYRAAANMGTLTGAPKVRAMELIREAEPAGRGFYGGAFGYLLADGSLDTCIAIRSLRLVDGVAHTRAGAGIVADSDPQREFEETEHKARAVCQAVAAAEDIAAGSVSGKAPANRGSL